MGWLCPLPTFKPMGKPTSHTDNPWASQQATQIFDDFGEYDCATTLGMYAQLLTRLQENYGKSTCFQIECVFPPCQGPAVPAVPSHSFASKAESPREESKKSKTKLNKRALGFDRRGCCVQNCSIHRFECAISYPVGRFIADTSVVDERILQGGDSKLLILKAGFMIPISLCCLMRQSRQTFASITYIYIYAQFIHKCIYIYI